MIWVPRPQHACRWQLPQADDAATRGPLLTPRLALCPRPMPDDRWWGSRSSSTLVVSLAVATVVLLVGNFCWAELAGGLGHAPRSAQRAAVEGALGRLPSWCAHVWPASPEPGY